MRSRDEGKVYNLTMSEHEDRSPLLLKVILRQALARLQEEDSSLAQLESLAANLGWEETSGRLAEARRGLAKAREGLQDAVEAAVRLQASAVHSHPHTHVHEHEHERLHLHDHQHLATAEGDEGHAHEHVREHPHEHPHD